jgi:hypothetical protein
MVMDFLSIFNQPLWQQTYQTRDARDMVGAASWNDQTVGSPPFRINVNAGKIM